MRKKPDDRSHLVGGSILIVLGLIFLGSELQWGPGWSIVRLWPLIPLTVGVIRLATPGDRAGGAWFALVGVVFLLHNYHVLHVGRSWPLFVVAAGVAILLGSRRAGHRQIGASAGGGHHDR